MPHWGNRVDYDRLKTRNEQSKIQCALIMDAVLNSVSSAVKETRSTVVVEHSESFFIAAIVSKSIDADGKNLESSEAVNERYDVDTKALIKYKESAVKLMESNYSNVPIEQIKERVYNFKE
jgi:hypothetical protein